MAKGYECPECRKFTGRYAKGAYHCSGAKCGAVWWSAFDRPSAGAKRKGHKCMSCSNHTMHPVATVAAAEIWRCSTCATTVVLAV